MLNMVNLAETVCGVNPKKEEEIPTCLICADEMMNDGYGWLCPHGCNQGPTSEESKADQKIETQWLQN